MRQDNRVGVKHLIVITQKLVDPENPDDENLNANTVEIIKFFKDSLEFKGSDILYIHQNEVKQIENLLNLSEVFKTYPKNIDQKLRAFAKRTFLEKGNHSNAR